MPEEYDPKRTARVTIRFRERERRKLEREARGRGVYLSELIRRSALKDVEDTADSASEQL